MRLPFPERIPIVPATYFAGFLCIVQLLQKTDPTFALGTFLFIPVAVLAFNVAGGFTRPSGAYIFFFSVLGFLIGVCWKAVLNEPAHTNLIAPLLSMGVYLGCACSMLVAAIIARRLTRKRGLLSGLVNESNMQRATIGCMITGLVLSLCLMLLPPGGSGSVLSALNQLNGFFPLAMILGVVHTIRRSGGRRSVNLPVLLTGTMMFAEGLLGFSKQGIITPFICWLMAAASERYTISKTQIAAGALTAFFIFHYLVPYAQYGRVFRGDTSLANVSVSLSLLSHLGDVREEYLETSAASDDELPYMYYNTPQGFFDRLQMFSMDDALIAHTEETGTIGPYPLIVAFENDIPHFIWKDKPTLNAGNIYAHDIGLLSEDDESTGVSFSPAGEAYHLFGWYGIFLVTPILWIALFAVIDSLIGEVRGSPWGLLMAVAYAHVAPEGGLGAIAYVLFFTVIGLIFGAVVTSYVMPIVGTFFIGPEGVFVRRGAPIRSIPGRLRAVRPSGS